MPDPLPYDALLLVSFGGPEQREDVIPFLENVLRGKNVPRERMLEVAEHYYHFDGVSPINEQCRQLLAALREEFAAHQVELPIYWGNRNWAPYLADTLQQMQQDGVRRALGFFTSAYSSYSGCRQYRENIAAAQAEVGPAAPAVEKLRAFFNHPGFIEPMISHLGAALAEIPQAQRATTPVLFTAHSIPLSMSATCDYVAQLQEACRLVAAGAGVANWQLVYQSRSGPPSQPWLEPDIRDALARLAAEEKPSHVVVVPIGFISDHLEVLYDLDYEAQAQAQSLGMRMIRTPTVGHHPRFVQMIRELVEERLTDNPQRLALGNFGPSHDVCAVDCCRYEPRRPA
jgi:ferrochelatase